MRDLRKNKQTITYSNPTGEITYEINTDGFKTGRKVPTYGTPQTLDINIRINRGGVWLRDYGISTEYDAIMTTTDKSCPIDEGSLVTFQNKKYVVSRQDVSLNELKLYLAEVK